MTSQNQVEEAVLAATLALVERLHQTPIIIADRGFGRKELLIRVVHQGRHLAIRIDADITVCTADVPQGALLATVLATQPSRGEVVWDLGQEGTLVGQVRTITGTMRFSRSGRKADSQEATLHFVQLTPDHARHVSTDPLVLATTLPITTIADIKGIVRLYSWRWPIERLFLSWKSHGWDLEACGVTAPARVARLFSGYVLATWWLVAAALPGAQAYLDTLASHACHPAGHPPPRPCQLRLPLFPPPRPWLAKASLLTQGRQTFARVDGRTSTPPLLWQFPEWDAPTWSRQCLDIAQECGA